MPPALPAATPEGMALVGIIMGSTSDWETMRHAAQTLDALGVAHETRIVSAHPELANKPRKKGKKAASAGRARPSGPASTA